jgi:hypothetical protein
MCRWGTSRMVRLCQPKEVSGRTEVLVYACIAPLVQMLNDFGVHTTGACCGHSKAPGWISYEQDGEQREMRIQANCEQIESEGAS